MQMQIIFVSVTSVRDVEPLSQLKSGTCATCVEYGISIFRTIPHKTRLIMQKLGMVKIMKIILIRVELWENQKECVPVITLI